MPILQGIRVVKSKVIIDEKCEMDVILGDHHDWKRHFNFMTL